MKRLILVSAVVIAAGAMLLELIREDSGYVLIALGSVTIETSFWVAVAIVAGAVILVWFLLSLIKRIRHGVRGGLGLGAKRSRRVERRTSAGLIYFIEGNWRSSKKELLKAAKHADNPLVHYLAAARCAFELGDQEESRKLLHRAEQAAPDNELAVNLSQARIQLLDKRYEQCLATLKRAREISPQHPTVLDLLRQVYWQLRDWRALQDLLPELRKQKLYKDEEQDLLEQNVSMALLSAAGKNGSGHGEPSAAAESLDQVKDTWRNLPKKTRQQTPVVALYAKRLIALSASAEAETLLRRHLAEHWDAELVNLFGLAAGEQPKDQLMVGERWLRDHASDPDLLLALGRVCLRNELWGKARGYFESSLKLGPRPETYAELARLMAYLGEHEKSTELYQQGLLTSTHGLPNLPMPHKGNNWALGHDERERQEPLPTVTG